MFYIEVEILFPCSEQAWSAGQSAANALQSKVEETQASIKAEAKFD